jgi:hypothetical protein
MVMLSREADDPLGVLSSTLRVVQRASQVQLDLAQVEGLAARWAAGGWQVPAWNAALHFNDGTWRTVNWVLLVDALNFCFWGEAGQPRWSVEYRVEVYNGYWAETASLLRALDEGRPLWDARYLADLTLAELEEIFRPVLGASCIPLLEERLAHASQVGQVLLAKYGGQFVQAVEAAQGSAVRLVQQIVADFASFDDRASYGGAEVRFFKRAQICVADLHGTFGGQGWGAFHDLDALTMFADYKLPQVLRRAGILRYAPELSAKVANLELLPAGSAEEVEIRAATIWAGELLRRALAERGIDTPASEIDYLLWVLGQTPTPDDVPYHRTRTIYY